MAAAGRLRQDCRHDRRVDGYRTDETARTAVGVSFQTGLAAPFDHGGRCAVQLPAGAFHLLNDSFAWGDQYIKVQEAPLGMDFNETAKAVGFQDGDILLSADNVPFVRYDGDMLSQIADAREVSVLREGKRLLSTFPKI